MNINISILSIILCGGSGNRLKSYFKNDVPKQFAKFGFDGKSLFERTLERTEKFSDNILLISNQNFRNVLEQQITNKKHQYIFEPESRNTAASIIFSALFVAKNFPDSVMVIMPSDHWVEDENAFSLDVVKASKLAEKEDKIVLFGIKPHFSSESFGYIDTNKTKAEIYSVKKFVEKPKKQEAEKLIKNENIFWNSGIFIAKPKVILESSEKHSSEIFGKTKAAFASYISTGRIDKKLYSEIENLPFDKAVLEASSEILMLEADFDWLDIGTPERLELAIKKAANL